MPGLLSRWLKATARNAPESIDEALLGAAIAPYPFLHRLAGDDRAMLARMALAFLERFAITPTRGLILDDVTRVVIAAQACLPVLKLGLLAYPRFSEIIVYPTPFRVPRTQVDASGIVHEWEEPLAGESWEGGPVIVSLEDIAAADESSGSCVLVYEFVHQLDMANGEVDGVPRFMPGRHRSDLPRRWITVIEQAYRDFSARVDAIEAAIPRSMDSESPAAARYGSRLPMDAYASEDLGEFFSVAAETFFVAPRALFAAYPELYGLFCEYFLQDPAHGGRSD